MKPIMSSRTACDVQYVTSELSHVMPEAFSLVSRDNTSFPSLLLRANYFRHHAGDNKMSVVSHVYIMHL